MKDLLESLLRATQRPGPECAQRRWREYRDGANSKDPVRKAEADEAFAILLAWFGGSLYRHIWGFVRSDSAEDVFQDVIRKLHEQRLNHRLDSFENVLPWLRTVAIRQCIDAHRRRVRRAQRELSAARPVEIDGLDSPAELNESLAIALAKLPSNQQKAVALHYFEGLDKKDAATALGIHPDTLSAHLTSALHRLRQLIATPVGVLLACELSLSTALATVAKPPPVDRMYGLACAAWSGGAQATSAAWSFSLMLGLVLGGAVVAAGVMLQTDTPDTAREKTAERRPVESLQDRNIRIVRADVLPKLFKLSEQLVPPDNPLKVVDVRAFGSEVECEFQTERPIIPAWKPVGLKVRYCTLMRVLEVQADLKGDGSWKVIDLERPVILDLAIPGLPVPAMDLGRQLAADAKAAFQQIPDDDRTAPDQINRLFGADPAVLIVPPGLRGFSANAGRLHVVTSQRGLYTRDASGHWHFDGECPGWWLVANGNRFYCLRNGAIWIRDIDGNSKSWSRWCPEPSLRPGERMGWLTVSKGRIRVFVQPGVICSHSDSDPNAEWIREEEGSPIWPDGVAASADQIFGHDARHLLRRDAVRPGSWTPMARWIESISYLSVDGDRVIGCGTPGPILARPLSAGLETDWDVIGHVRVPPTR